MRMPETLVAACVVVYSGMIGTAQAQSPPSGVGYSPGAAVDKISWQSFIEVIRPVPAPNPTGALTFETWATDAETFDASTTPPTWPTGPSAERSQKRFQASGLGVHRPAGLKALVR
jgi:hypothetical protein